MRKKNVLVLIPTRLNSRRLPAKALLPINKLPLFEVGNFKYLRIISVVNKGREMEMAINKIFASFFFRVISIRK